MSDHINVHEVRRFDDRWESRLQFEKQKAELDLMTKRFEDAESQLSAIFTRIARGDEVQLHYANGDVITVVARPHPDHATASDAPVG